MSEDTIKLHLFTLMRKCTATSKMLFSIHSRDLRGKEIYTHPRVCLQKLVSIPILSKHYSSQIVDKICTQLS